MRKSERACERDSSRESKHWPPSPWMDATDTFATLGTLRQTNTKGKNTTHIVRTRLGRIENLPCDRFRDGRPRTQIRPAGVVVQGSPRWGVFERIILLPTQSHRWRNNPPPEEELRIVELPVPRPLPPVTTTASRFPGIMIAVRSTCAGSMTDDETGVVVVVAVDRHPTRHGTRTMPSPAQQQ
jgi:hypothetical protein